MEVVKKKNMHQLLLFLFNYHHTSDRFSHIFTVLNEALTTDWISYFSNLTLNTIICSFICFCFHSFSIDC